MHFWATDIPFFYYPIKGYYLNWKKGKKKSNDISNNGESF